MLRDASVKNGASESETTATLQTSAGDTARAAEPEWKRVHRRLSGHARARGAIDAAEARDLVRALELKIWLPLGYANILEYMERELDYGPRTALDRLRVSKALLELPGLRAELADGELSYSVVRELTRVATSQTEQAWIDRVRGRTARDAEALVAGHARGDDPDDPTDPELRMRTVRFELSPHAFALLRQATTALADERGGALDDSDLLEALCRAQLSAPADTLPRPAHQIAYKICPCCERATQNASGVEVDVGAATIALARCDAECLGSLDATTPERVVSTLTRRRRRQVFARDGYKCQAPGCRAGRGLDIHHIRPQAEGGGHQLWNCTVLCSSHHKHRHEGRLAITGKAPNRIEFRWLVPEAAPARAGGGTTAAGAAPPRPPQTAHVGAPPIGDVALRRAAGCKLDPTKDVRQALVGLGFRSHQARAAIAQACARVGTGCTPEELLREALRHCAR